MEKEVMIRITDETEAHPAAMLVQIASRYDSSVYMETTGKKVNAKSIMGMMSLDLKQGKTIVVSAEGPDEEDAVKGIEDFLAGNK
ncbi:MAG: HPr family phosphocarrier protein [Lachnospiraceae bacterium]|nr:HPr family phosphocarrier protein [Lachnospiraceae bacterium]